jgi:hypothetical protein
LRYGDTYAHSYCYTNPNSNIYAHSYCDTDCDPHLYSDTATTDTDPDCNTYPNCYCYGNGNVYTNADGYSFTNTGYSMSAAADD